MKLTRGQKRRLRERKSAVGAMEFRWYRYENVGQTKKRVSWDAWRMRARRKAELIAACAENQEMLKSVRAAARAKFAESVIALVPSLDEDTPL